MREKELWLRAHNLLVQGSSPSGPTYAIKELRVTIQGRAFHIDAM
jgi:hypothetical protein